MTSIRHAPPDRPTTPHRHDLTPAQRQRIEKAAVEAEVEPEPWLVWAEVAAITRGPEEATSAAILGAAFEPYWKPRPHEQTIEWPPTRREQLTEWARRRAARLRR